MRAVAREYASKTRSGLQPLFKAEIWHERWRGNGGQGRELIGPIPGFRSKP